MRRYLALVLASVLAAIPVGALAMGLGEIRLDSWLNQPLDAEIELVSAAADELESLEISLASSAAFERVGLRRDAFLNNLQFRVVRRPNGTAYVHVTSSEPVREPFLTFLIEADWSRGRLLREYTLLIDPPTFASREQGPAPQPQAPAVTLAPAPAERQEERTAPHQPEVVPDEPARDSSRVEERQTGDVISIPPLEADAEPVRREPVAQPQSDGTYGPIQRNETLWGISQRLRPDGVTINQMMIALFRANPEAFQGNINRLKAGYILRIPEYGEISGLARREAFNEVKRQNEEWRYGTSAPVARQPVDTAEPQPAEPELSLVAPEEEITPEVGTGIGAGGEADDLGLGSEDPLDLAADGIDEDAVDLGVEGDTQDRLLDIEDESLQALQEQETPLTPEESATESEPPPPLPLPEEQATDPAAEAADEGADADTTVTEEPAQEAVAEPEPEQSPPVVAPVRRSEPDLVERLTGLVMSPLGLGIGAAILVLLLAGFLVIRKRREAAQAQAAAVMADWNDDEASDDVTIVAGHGDSGIDGEDERDADGDIATVFAHGLEHEDTGTTRIEDDAEATRLLAESDKDTAATDFTETLAGGQAVTLDENDPLSEADFHMAYGLYDQAAEVVEKAVERDPARKDYLAKLAEIHFAANNPGKFLEASRQLKELTGPGDPDWDNVAIMGRQIAPDSELFAEGASAASVDLDFGSAGEEFSGEETVAGPEPEATPETPAAADSLDFDISFDMDEEPAASVDEEPAEPLSGAGTTESDDAGLELDMPADDQGEVTPAAESDDAFDFDLGNLDTDVPSESAASDASGGEDEETQTEFDKALQELSAFVDTNLPEQDAGDAVSGQDAELNLDEYSFDETDSELADETAGSGDDEEDIGEIGTKLDLARAYIDMGDPDGARGILEEVLSDGDAEQQKEARELIDQLA